MGYIYFLIVLAASGAIIVWWGGQRSALARKRKNSILSRQGTDRFANDPISVLKRAINRQPERQPETELEHTDFLARVDVWQKDHQVRRTKFNTNAESITGTKYTYTPPPKSHSAAARSK
jgi:hypothetical protein